LQVLEGETTREKNLDKAQKEAKVRARKAGAKSTFYQASDGAKSNLPNAVDLQDYLWQ
jgi:hypothetical protein